MASALTIKFYRAGFCKHPDCVITGRMTAKLGAVPMVTALIQHAKWGNILFDVGYSHNFFKATKKFPYFLYRWVTPVTFQTTDSLAYQLRQDGVNPETITTIFISHFHADHIAAIDDFPNANIICSEKGYQQALHATGFRALLRGILPDLIRLFDGRHLEFIEDKKLNKSHKHLKNFTCYDILGDGSMLAVALPGHEKGQHGLYCDKTNRGKVFFIADACWYLETIKTNRPPLPIVKLLSDNHSDYLNTIKKLHEFHKKNPAVTLVPCHCPVTFNSLTE